MEYRFLRTGNYYLRREGCDGQCNSCFVRFRCFTEPEFYPLLLDNEEWLKYWEYRKKFGLAAKLESRSGL